MKPYATPEAFKQALEARIRKAAPTNIGRFRQVLVFDRFLARVHMHFGDRVIVKGGVVLELRLDRARATKDVDLRLTGDPNQVLADLQAAGRIEVGDWLSFEIAEDRHHPVIQGQGMVYDGLRYRAEARLGGKLYASTFGVDVAFADPLSQEPEVISGLDFLSFAGVEPTLVGVVEAVRAFVDPVLDGSARGKTWDPPSMTWG